MARPDRRRAETAAGVEKTQFSPLSRTLKNAHIPLVMTEMPPQLFDRRLLRQRRARQAHSLHDFSFLVERVAEDMIDRIESITRDFERVLVLGGGPRFVPALEASATTGKLGHIIQTDIARRVAASLPGTSCACVDEENLPFADESFDLVLAPLNLHWSNDLPGTLIQINRALKPDGFLALALFGGQTLTELRRALMMAESALSDGVHNRVSPFAGTFDMAALLQRAGFALPVSDIDRLTVRYDSAFDLMRDLRGMGETSVLTDRPRRPASRALFMQAAALYAEQFSDPDGRIRASFEIVHAGGWAPHPDQPKPKRPGSATHSLAAALGTTEISAGEKAGG